MQTSGYEARGDLREALDSRTRGDPPATDSSANRATSLRDISVGFSIPLLALPFTRIYVQNGVHAWSSPLLSPRNYAKSFGRVAGNSVAARHEDTSVVSGFRATNGGQGGVLSPLHCIALRLRLTLKRDPDL